MSKTFHRHLRALWAASAIALVVFVGLPASEAAAVTCPSPIPAVNENNCQGAGTTAWRLSTFSKAVAGFTTQSSVNLGSSVALKVGRLNPGSVDISVYRMGYYGGTGGRLVHSAAGVAVGNSLNCNGINSTTGLVNCNNWSTTYTIPGASLPASGIYLAKLRATDTGGENHVIFTVRDDARTPDVLFKLPNATYQAYNNFGDKSLYDFSSQEPNTISGGKRAVKVSFDRPFEDPYRQDNWFLKSDYALVFWLERQGYDVAYTDDPATHANPSELLQARSLVISGHDEYWSREQMIGYLNARNAGVDVASFSANTAYWKVRYEDGGRTLVCHKTVQGSGSAGSGSVGSNDWGPDGALGTADDALGLDGQAGTGDDRPENSSTTFRDNGAAPGDPNAPAGGRVGPNMPENALFGSMYVGDHDSLSYPLRVPAASSGEFAGDRIWRNTGVPSGSATNIGSRLVGWEWDAVPTQAQYLAQQPAGVKRLTDTNTNDGGSGWIQDEGRVYATSPPPGQPGTTSAVKYTAASGALVFSAGTNQWSWGLGPHFRDEQVSEQTYAGPVFDSTDARIQQATYNIFSDMGVQPNTPAGIILDGGNQPPEASFTVSPNPALTGQTVTFNGAGSTDSDGSISRYEWDLDGNGSFETDGGAAATTTRSYASAATINVGLRVTDNGGSTAQTTRSLAVVDPGGGGGVYADAVQATAGLQSYWRMGELSGTTLVDSKGGNHGSLSGSALGAPGAISGDSNTAVSFDGADDSASAPLNLSGTSRTTVEFWLKWDAFANDDDLALELTPNFNGQPGGLLVDPNAPQNGGTFGVAIGSGLARNNAFFARPSAGAWHHYALVLDSTAAPTAQITPYVDGVAVPYTKTESGTGAGAFANSILYFMSRAGTGLFGAGDLDELAVYNQSLSAATIADHYTKGIGGPANQVPTASFTATPNPTTVGQTVSFNGSASSDPDGSISRYEWDLDGNGSYETDTGSTATTTRSYAAAGDVTVGLRVTDNGTGTGTTTRVVAVNAAGNQVPSASFTVSPNPAVTGDTVTFNGGASADPDGSIARYEWDLDGNGSFETDGGATATTTRSYSSAATLSIGLRVTDNGGSTGQTTRTLTVTSASSYAGAVLGTAGLQSYWRMGELTGTTLADSKGTSNATVSGASLGAAGALAGDSNTAVSFDGFDDNASAPVNLSGTSTATVEFWLKWDAFSNNDDLALEHTANFNANDGGFLVDPNSPQEGGRFGIGIGRGLTRNNAFFARPSAGAWHHYALVLDTTAPAATQIVPYVDGVAVPYTKLDSGTGAGPFANSTLYFMSRAASALIGAGDLDELAVYNQALSAATIADHHQRGTGGGQANQSPSAAFTPAPSPAQTGQQVNFDGAGSSDPDGSVARYEWDLDGNGSFETDTGATATTSRTYAAAGSVTVGLRITDNGGATAQTTRSLTVNAPTNQAPTASFTVSPSPALTGQTVTFNGTGSADPDGSVARYEWDLDGNGSFETDTGATATTSRSYSAAGTVTVGLRVTDNGGTTAQTTRSLTVNTPANPAPTASFTVAPSPAATRQTVTFNGSASSDPGGSIARYEWDLDGNGSFETDTGATASTTRVYNTVGTITVGLRVTDNGGATGQTTRSLTVASAYAQAVLGTTGVRGYWRLGDTGTTAADSSTSANPGTYTNGPVSVAGLIAGEQNSARDLDGVNDWVDFAPAPFGAPAQVSAEAWVRTGSTKPAGGYHFLITNSSNDFNNGFSLAIDSANRATFVVARSSLRGQATGSVTLAPNTTHHVVGTYNGTTARIYVDGVERANALFSGGIGWNAGRDLRLGRKVAAAGAATAYLDGVLDEAAVYTTALPAATVLAHYNAGKP